MGEDVGRRVALAAYGSAVIVSSVVEAVRLRDLHHQLVRPGSSWPALELELIVTRPVFVACAALLVAAGACVFGWSVRVEDRRWQIAACVVAVVGAMLWVVGGQHQLEPGWFGYAPNTRVVYSEPPSRWAATMGAVLVMVAVVAAVFGAIVGAFGRVRVIDRLLLAVGAALVMVVLTTPTYRWRPLGAWAWWGRMQVGLGLLAVAGAVVVVAQVRPMRSVSDRVVGRLAAAVAVAVVVVLS